MTTVFYTHLLVGRLITAIIGALAVPLGYALARTLGLGRAGALATGLVIALSPWQIFMSRTALPPALVPTFWTCCLLAGVSFIRCGDRRSGLGLALAAGVTLYAYPTLKLAAPLLVALALALAMLVHLRRPAPSRPTIATLFSAWLPAGLLLALLWMPFAYVTLFNSASATRLGQTALHADSWGAWFSAWLAGYAVYFLPDFYYRSGDGSSIRGVQGFGVELWAGLPLLLLGLASLIGRIARPSTSNTERQSPLAIFVLGALLIAAFPASLTTPSPHTYRAAPLAPLYALLVGYGAALLLPDGLQRTGTASRKSLPGLPIVSARAIRWPGAGFRRPATGTRPPNPHGRDTSTTRYKLSESCTSTVWQWWSRHLIALALAGALLWQGARWWRAYTQDYPALQAAQNQDGLAEAVRRAVELAPQYDEIWVSYDSIDQPYLFVLIAQPFPPAEAQRLITVERHPNHFNAITGIGPYRFVNTNDMPADLPTLVAVPGSAGEPGYVVQAWMSDGKRILVVRGM